MSRILHLSDLHLLATDRLEQGDVLAALVDAAAVVGRESGAVDLILVSGDVFDSAKTCPALAVRAFAKLLSKLRVALGAEVPAVVVPGNHDCRTSGIIGPHRSTLFEALRDARLPGLFVHGTRPTLAAVVPHALHGQPLWLMAYDSSYLHRGWIGAGGTLRQEDLLHAASQIDGRQPDWPLIFLVHHHLVPTPVSDVAPIHTDERSALVRWSVREVLPRLLAHADREEWMMTALGAGTALTTLSSLGRSVLVLHGHKHNATSRLLKGMVEGQGDVLIASAGSAGTAHSASGAETRKAARIWPSFNVIELNEGELSIETVAFGWKGRSRGELDHRPLASARRRGAHWMARPIPLAPPPTGPRMQVDEGRFVLVEGERRDAWDLRVGRRVMAETDSRTCRYVETLEGSCRIGGALLDTPFDITLDADPIEYVVEAAAPRLHRRGECPFASVEMLVRYPSAQASLCLVNAPRGAFGSLTDAGNGLERPVSIERRGGDAVVEVEACPARTWIRIYWPIVEAPEAEVLLAPSGGQAREEIRDARQLPARDGAGSGLTL